MTDLFLERDAVLSEDGKYRYLLRRTWDARLPRALFVMLNPSTADAAVDDATIRSCIRLCRSWNYGSFEVVNLFAWRATDPNELRKVPDPIGLANDRSISAAAGRCDVLICAWGAHQIAAQRGAAVWHLIRQHRPAVFCLGVTKDGSPKHPLYIKSGTPLVNFARSKR